jgi:Ca2+-binding RTX toxin-like protein
MPNVTVAGAHSSIVTVPYNTASNALIAQQLADAITAGVSGGSILPYDNQYTPTPPTIPGGKSGEFVVSQTAFVTLPTGYSALVVTAAGAVVTGSGDPNESVLGGTGGVKFLASAGSGTIALGGGSNQVILGAGDTGSWGIYTDTGNDVIQALNTGSDTISAGLGDNSILLGGGTYQIATTGDDVIQAGAGNVTVGATGSGSDYITGGSGNLVFLGNSTGNVTITGGSGSDTYFGGSGSAYVQGGSAGNNFLFAGTGATTLIGGGSGDQLYANGSAGQVLEAASGNATLSGLFSSGADTFYAGSGSDQITGSFGADTFVGGTGAASITAGLGGTSDVFQFVDGSSGGTDLVAGLTSASQVSINLVGYGPNEAQNAVNTQSSTANSVTITLSDNTKITFDNITHLSTSNFT